MLSTQYENRVPNDFSNPGIYLNEFSESDYKALHSSIRILNGHFNKPIAIVKLLKLACRYWRAGKYFRNTIQRLRIFGDNITLVG
jgi:hypothetical protein